MFLERILDLGLLKHAPDTNILGPLPLAVRRKMIWEVVQCLSPKTHILPSPPASILTSNSHVLWMMELLGAGFALPIEDVNIITECINVYRLWLIEGKEGVPPAVRAAKGGEFEQHFLQASFMHMSLLFQPRKPHDANTLANAQPSAEPLSADVLCTTHVSLCRQILVLLLTCSQQQSQKHILAHSATEFSFSKETWVVLVKVILGCADRLLLESTSIPLGNEKGNRRSSYLDTGNNNLVARWGRGDRDRSPGSSLGLEHNYGPKMGDALGDLLSKVLFEVWLRSGEMSPDLWACLKEEYDKWNHRIEVIRNWSAVVLGLTNRIINHLFGEGEGAAFTIIHWATGGSFNLDLNEDFTAYAWHRIIYIVGNINNIDSPEIFHVAVKGVGKMVEAFHNVGINRDYTSKTNAPDGNTLLNMFGPWLFEAVARRSPEYEDGISEAYGILCRIFCHRQPRHGFLPTYLAQFYSAVSNGLRKGHPQSLTAIIMNCGELFSMDLHGARVLVLDFSIGIKRVVPSAEKIDGFPVDVMSMEELRRGALKLVGSIMGILNHFQSVSIKTKLFLERNHWSEKIQELYKTYGPDLPRRSNVDASLPQDPSQMTQKPSLGSLKPFFLDVLINSLSLEHDAGNCKAILHLLSCFIYQEIDFCPGSATVILDVVKEKILSKAWPQDVMTAAFDFLAQVCVFWQPINNAVEGSVKDVVLTICNYIDGLFLEDSVITNQIMITKAYDCMIRWALIGGWMEKERDCIRKVNSTLTRGVSILAQDDDFSIISGSNTNSFISASGSQSALKGSATSGSSANVFHSLGQTPSSPANSTTSALANHFAAFAGNVTSAMSSERSRRFKKSGKQRGSTISSPLATLVAAVTTSAAAAAKDTIPASPTRSDHGVSTFAKLTAESAVKSAAEIALAQLLNHLGNFPAKGFKAGVSRISTLYDEFKEVKRILAVRQRLAQDSIFGSNRSSVDSQEPEHPKKISLDSNDVSNYKKYLRYYVYDNRIILGFLEQPAWAMDDNDSLDSDSDFASHEPKDPKVVLIIRDPTGKFSWLSRLKYLDDTPKKPSTSSSQTRSSSRINTEKLVTNNLSVVAEPPKRSRPMSAPHGGRQRTTEASPDKAKTAHESEGNLLELLEVEIAASSSVIGDSALLPSMPEKLPPYSVRPKLPPYIPPNSEVLRGESFNESAIPKFSDLVNPDSEEGRKYEVWKKTLDKYIQIEKDTYSSHEDELVFDTAARPAPPIDQYDPNIPSAVFRLFLTHMGYLGIDHHDKLKPLVMTETLVRDIEKMDALSERECFGVSVLFAKSSFTEMDNIIKPKAFSQDFYKFLGMVGTPVSLDKHVGYKGSLNVSFCKTSSYFATRNSEIIFHTPYTMRPQSQRSEPEVSDLRTLYLSCTSENHVLILWVESLLNISEFVKSVTYSLSSNVTTVIVIHPQESAPGLYDIRLMLPNGSVEENGAIGPLVDGMIVPREALGNLVRMTAQSAHLQARIMKPNYRRPQTARRLMIEEICNKHKLATTWAGFYADLFSN